MPFRMLGVRMMTWAFRFGSGVYSSARQNLWNALNCLRLKAKKSLWVDALCINQKDVHERNHQVSFMGTIYENASVVLVWLGYPREPPDDSDDQNSDIRLLGNIRNSSSILGFDLLKLSTAEVSLSQPSSRRSFLHWADSIVWNADLALHWHQLAQLLQNPYWRRLWIVQEIILAPKLELIYGTHSCDWEHLTTLLYTIRQYEVFSECQRHLPRLDGKASLVARSFAGHLDSQRYARRINRLPATGLKSLLATCETSYCQDPRDKIYGILGLASDISKNKISVDYSKSLFEIWEDVVRQNAIQDGDDVHTVHFAQFVQRVILGPLSANSEPRDIEIPALEECKFNKISLSGIVMGEIAASDVKPEDLYRREEDLLQYENNRKNPEYQKSSLHSSEVDPKITYSFLHEWGRAWRQLWVADHGVIADSVFTTCNIATGKNTKETSGAIARRLSIFKVRKTASAQSFTHLGIASSLARPGDFLCRFEHSDITTILRTSGKEYNLICRALVSPREPGTFEVPNTTWPPPRFPRMHLEPGQPHTLSKATGTLRDLQGMADSVQDLYQRNIPVSFEVDTRVLQALTCPLKARVTEKGSVWM